MDVNRYDVITTANTAHTLFTVPEGKAYTVTGFTVVETAGNAGQLTLAVGYTKNNTAITQTIGQFGISGPDTIYPITNINLTAGESLNATCSIANVYITASTIERDV